MSASATTRQVVRTLAHRAEIDWSRSVFSCSPEVAASFNKLKSWVAMSESMHQKYSSPPGPVDFASAKKAVRDGSLVDSLQTFYKSNMPPPETFEWPQEEQELTEKKLAYLKELDGLNKELLPVLQSELEFQQSNRTSAETTITEMKANYPVIHEEIEDELERREWFKDTGIGANK